MTDRTEEKYLAPEGLLRVLQLRLSAAAPLISPDRHGHPDYRVRSLYFDGPDRPCLEENEAGTDSRSKYRLRLYDGNTGLILLEKKTRTGERCRKAQCVLARETAERLLLGHIAPAPDAPPLQNELAGLTKTAGFRPALLVYYSRTAFLLTAGRVRLTFDRNIRGTRHWEAFFDPVPVPAVPCLPPDTGLLELKYTGFLPDTVPLVLDTPGLRRTAFSKYRMCSEAAVEAVHRNGA